ncbi:DUF6415 family natural product biosynthesis protein [Streptomyces sp. NPDC047706]|uniref:DUF6415 family natural product biosynthesis protein n=1 Tax=Streptomyces sp. NPDC047706 TaxID=3365486 RepID=UPI003710286A
MANARDAEPPGSQEPTALAVHLRGQLAVLVGEVEAAAPAAPEDAPVRAAAHAGIREARRLMAVSISRLDPDAGLAHVRRLARSVDELRRHHAALNSGPVTNQRWRPDQLAFRRWAIHGTTCRVCRTDDSRCERGRRLGGHWNQLRRKPAGAGPPLVPTRPQGQVPGPWS